MGTWHDLDVGRPIAAPLERCAELLGVNLATIRELAANIEPYIRADGTRIWSLMQLERSSGPRRTAGVGAVISTADGSRLPMPSQSGRRCCGMRAVKCYDPSIRLSSDLLYAIYGRPPRSRPIWLSSCRFSCPLGTVIDRC